MHEALAKSCCRTQAGAEVVHVIDDDEAVRRSLALLLFSAGYAVRDLCLGRELPGRVARDHGRLRVVDVRMPGMDGLQLQEQLTAHGAHLPVVVVTGHADIALAVRAMKAGARDFIEKPYTNERMIEAVRRRWHPAGWT